VAFFGHDRGLWPDEICVQDLPNRSFIAITDIPGHECSTGLASGRNMQEVSGVERDLLIAE